MRTTIHALGIVLLVVLLNYHSDALAQGKVKVMSDAPLRPAFEEIAEAFHRDSGNRVEFVFGTSPVIHKKVADGEAADVLVIQPNFIAELVKTGKVVPGDHPIVGRVGFGLAVRANASARDISSLEAFEQVLINADSVIFNNVASGNYFAKVLERLGIAEAVKPKVARLDPFAVFDRVIEGKGNDIGVGVIPLINTTKGLRLLGPLPPEVQSQIAYATAPMTATAPEAGKTFINFLASPAAKAVLAANGVE
jgi:molybdate transport system substrate-binding protein